jgi:hypothetical protein
MEGFEQFVAIALEDEGFVVSSAVKFRVQQPTRKAAYDEVQTHGYEVDLVGARSDRLVLATVKSLFGSRGVVAEHVTGRTATRRSRNLYMLLNNETVRNGVIEAASERYGYRPDQVQLRLYAGKFAAPRSGKHEKEIRAWCAEQHAGGGPIEVVGLQEVVARVRQAAAHKQYRDNPIIVAMKVLLAAGLLSPDSLGSGSE